MFPKSTSASASPHWSKCTFWYNIFSFALPSTPTKKSAAGSIVVTVDSSAKSRVTVTVPPASAVSIPVEPATVAVFPFEIVEYLN